MLYTKEKRKETEEQDGNIKEKSGRKKRCEEGVYVTN